MLDRYDALESAHGVHLTSQVTLRTTDQAQVMRWLRAIPRPSRRPPVTELTDLAASLVGSSVPRADVLILRLAGARVALRPSGTEPKIKCYIEITDRWPGGAPGRPRVGRRASGTAAARPGGLASDA